VVKLGSSGSGKSTLLNILGDMDVLSEGNVYMEGENIIGFVLESYNLMGTLTPRGNAELATDEICTIF
jgi:putative ABC transport system ATP-binding protein